MSGIPTEELIDHLQRSVRRWKTLALTLLIGMGLVIVFAVGATVVQARRARQAEMAARQAEMEARQRAEEAQDQARRNLYVAQMSLAQQEWEQGGKTCVEYDRPSSLFGQFGNASVTEVAAMLDRKL